LKAWAASSSAEVTAACAWAAAAASPRRAFSMRAPRWPKIGSGWSMLHWRSLGWRE
jgi:hypothetical protein